MNRSRFDEESQETSLIYVVGRVNQGITRQLRSALSAFGLSVQEYTALSVLQARPGLSNAQLARRALVTPQSMIEILAKLEARGLVARQVDPDHGRILRAGLTGDGAALLARADPAATAVQDDVFRAVSERDRKALMRGMHSAMLRLSAEPEDY